MTVARRGFMAVLLALVLAPGPMPAAAQDGPPLPVQFRPHRHRRCWIERRRVRDRFGRVRFVDHRVCR